MNDEEEIIFFIDIYQYLCESNLEIIYNENRFDLIEIMAELSKNVPVKRLTEITDFWQRFLHFFKSLNTNIDTLNDNYGKLIVETLMGLMKFFKFDDDIFTGLNQKKKKEYINDDSFTTTVEYRDSLKFFFQDFANFFSFSFFYDKILLPQISIVGSQLEKSPTNINLWCCLEALLYCFYCIAPGIIILF